MLALCLMFLGTYYTLPIMLALCLMLLGTYYAQNYAGIIGRSLELEGPGFQHHSLWNSPAKGLSIYKPMQLFINLSFETMKDSHLSGLLATGSVLYGYREGWLLSEVLMINQTFLVIRNIKFGEI